MPHSTFVDTAALDDEAVADDRALEPDVEAEEKSQEPEDDEYRSRSEAGRDDMVQVPKCGP